ncbi:MAG: aminopeptidase P family N-terminal domain-containing protein [Butyrivibrio sp.]|nr:aminopeptidase P family N-terminal domain-containing protein [Butyrivibrio sp.]
MENRKIMDRLAILRSKMEEDGIDYYMIPTSDFHNSEYAADFFKVREYFSNFTGSNGTLIVSKDWAGMWTDGRYFIQAEREMEGTGVTLYRMMDEGVPTINAYLYENMQEGQCLGFDGRVISAEIGEELENDLAEKNIRFRFDKDLAEEVWTDRPQLPCHDLYVLSDALCGKSFAQKTAEVRKQMREYKTDAYLLCKLDDIMWLTNLRGNDVECNPVGLSYAFLTMDTFYLFVQLEEVTDQVHGYCAENGIVIKNYNEIIPFLQAYEYNGKVLFDKRNVNYTTYRALLDHAEKYGSGVRNEKDPTAMMKAIKNETELRNIHEVYLRDSAALCRFIYWVKTNAGKIPMTEYSAAMYLDDLRSRLPGFIELSFPTISAYGANAAMMHYEATKDIYSEIRPEGMLLVDSGATYMGGTTDVTRTIVLGKISSEIKKHFTAVAIGMLQLANCNFLQGCYGRNLDIMARQSVWNLNIDYKCGTGHGIGYMLNVHEGPQNIRWAMRPGLEDAVLTPGMIVSDEPGVYREGSHGIRTENILEVAAGEKNSDGQFLHFNQLTYAPIDLEAIDKDYMQPRDIEALNSYHEAVYTKIAPLIEEPEIRAWLREQTRAI